MQVMFTVTGYGELNMAAGYQPEKPRFIKLRIDRFRAFWRQFIIFSLGLLNVLNVCKFIFNSYISLLANYNKSIHQSKHAWESISKQKTTMYSTTLWQEIYQYSLYLSIYTLSAASLSSCRVGDKIRILVKIRVRNPVGASTGCALEGVKALDAA